MLDSSHITRSQSYFFAAVRKDFYLPVLILRPDQSLTSILGCFLFDRSFLTNLKHRKGYKDYLDLADSLSLEALQQPGLSNRSVNIIQVLIMKVVPL